MEGEERGRKEGGVGKGGRRGERGEGEGKGGRGMKFESVQ